MSTTSLSVEVPKLYNFLSSRDIDNIQAYFKSLKSPGLSYEKFRSLMARFNITYSDDAFQTVCLKIDLDRDNVVNWSEFIAFFILEMENDYRTKERLSIIPPIPKSATVIASTLQNQAIRVEFDGTTENEKYITIGCYGDVNFWSPKWKIERTIRVGKSC